MSAFILAATSSPTSVIMNGYVVFNSNGQALVSFSPNNIEWSSEVGVLSAGHVFNDSLAGLSWQLAESSDRFAESPIAAIVPVSKECLTGAVEPTFDPLVIKKIVGTLTINTAEAFLVVVGRVETLHRNGAAKEEWLRFLADWALIGFCIGGGA